VASAPVHANGPNEGAPILVRWTLHRPSGRLTETVIDDRGDEFPRINGRYSGQAYRYVYRAHWGDDVTFGPPRSTTGILTIFA
jgi:carotenoid cleavage dioxygenase-like enzyme